MIQHFRFEVELNIQHLTMSPWRLFSFSDWSRIKLHFAVEWNTQNHFKIDYSNLKMNKIHEQFNGVHKLNIYDQIKVNRSIKNLSSFLLKSFSHHKFSIFHPFNFRPKDLMNSTTKIRLISGTIWKIEIITWKWNKCINVKQKSQWNSWC